MKSMVFSLGTAALFFAVSCWGAGWNFAVSGILSLLLYGALLLLTKPRKKIGGVDVELISGGEELEKKLQEAREDFASIGQSMAAIEDLELKRESQRLHKTAGNLIHFLEKNPEKIMSARRFIDYYQDTASKLLKKYVELQKLRYGEDAFRFEVIEDAQVGESHIPSLVLQTLVENSVVHAVNLDRMVEISVYITSEVYEDGKYLYLCVSDTGKGISPEIMEAIEKDLPIVYNGRKHVGLQNIKRRLMLLYGERASMTIQNMGENYGAIVEIRIPQNEE